MLPRCKNGFKKRGLRGRCDEPYEYWVCPNLVPVVEGWKELEGARKAFGCEDCHTGCSGPRKYKFPEPEGSERKRVRATHVTVREGSGMSASEVSIAKQICDREIERKRER